jgi:NCAIR mutase (PurE)-related protein
MKHRALSIFATMIATFGFAVPRALAHPGHGLDTTGIGALHFLLQPGHSGVALVVTGALVAASIAIKRRRHG